MQRLIAARSAFVAAFSLCFVGALPADAQERMLALGTASGQPGEIVEIPVSTTVDHPAIGLQGFFIHSLEHLEFLGYDVSGSAADAGDPLVALHNSLGGGDALFGVRYSDRESVRGFSLPPGSELPIGRLLFRIRADAPVGETALSLVPRVESAGGNSAFETFDVTFEFTDLRSGSIAVEAPAGPRPVGDLECDQFLDRVRLSFTPTEVYDGIEVRRDGDLLATLSGDTESFETQVETLGRQRYELVAVAGDRVSIAVGCDVVVNSPTAPTVAGLSCEDDGSLTWRNPVTFDGIFVFRDGAQIAMLEGDAASFTDPSPSDAVTVYTVITELSSFRSPETSCVANGTWIFEVADVQVPVTTTRVSVPVFATHPIAVQGIQLGLDLGSTESPLRLVTEIEPSLQGTVSDFEPEVVRIGPGPHRGGAVAVLFDALPPAEEEKDLPPGLRQHVFNWVFDIEPGTFADGDVVALPVVASVFTVRPATSAQPDELIDGEIRFGSSGVAAVEDLRAEVSPGGGGDGDGGGGVDANSSVALSWSNGGSYDSVEVFRNGTQIATLPSGATEYVDNANGVLTYKVIGVEEAESSFPQSVFVSTISPPGSFLRGDANDDSDVDLSDAIATLTFLFVGNQPIPCEDAADSNDDGTIDLSDALSTLNFLFVRGPAPRSPGVAFPWFDPTPDALGCEGS